MQPGQLYHYSITTLKLQPLLFEEYIFDKVIHNLQLLANAKQIKIYGYLVLSNRLEFLWEMTHKDDEESPHIQFLKLSSFDFLELLRQKDKKLLDLFCIDMLFQKIQFWQKSSNPVQVIDELQASVILERMHKSSIKKNIDNSRGLISSNAFYKKGYDPYNFMQHYQNYFRDISVNVN